MFGAQKGLLEFTCPLNALHYVDWGWVYFGSMTSTSFIGKRESGGGMSSVFHLLWSASDTSSNNAVPSWQLLWNDKVLAQPVVVVEEWICLISNCGLL